jgi:hypothetical protein
MKTLSSSGCALFFPGIFSLCKNSTRFVIDAFMAIVPNLQTINFNTSKPYLSAAMQFQKVAPLSSLICG